LQTNAVFFHAQGRYGASLLLLVVSPRIKRYWLTLALVATGCFGPDENVLFEPDGALAVVGGGAAMAGTSPSAAAGSGTDSGVGSTGGTAGASGGGGRGGAAGTGSAGGGGGGDVEPVIESCDAIPDSVVSAVTGHCYRVNEALLTFDEARAACDLAGAHLVTIGSAEENELARDLHDGEHWLGATDELGDDVAEVGLYVWVNGEPWVYSDWQEGQPNAYQTDCPDDADADCYEHCGFQSDEGDWLDRSCWHTIASICEWDVPAGDAKAANAAP
jgi:Lectin C-type domain